MCSPDGRPTTRAASPALNLQLLTFASLHRARRAHSRPARCAQLFALYGEQWPRLPPRRTVPARVVRPVAGTQSLLLYLPLSRAATLLTQAARVPAARGSPLPHPTNTAAPPSCAMRSAARARPEPGAQQEKEGASAAGGTRGAVGGARHSHSRPASRVAGPISACRRSRALCGTRSLAWPAPPNSRGPGPEAKSANSGGGPRRTGGGKGRTRDLSGKPVPTEHPRRSVCSGCRSLPVRDPLPTASCAALGGQQLSVPSTTERQRPDQNLSLPAELWGETHKA